MEYGNSALRAKGKAFALVISIVFAIVALCTLPSIAYGDAGDVPAHSKTLTQNGVTADNPNGDGTYKLALSVTGDALDEIQQNGSANIVLVYDVSQSMTNRIGGGNSPRRADATEDVVHDFLVNLNRYKQQGSDIDVSLVTFSRTGGITQNWTDNVASLANRFDDGGNDGQYNFTYDRYPDNYGTNWEHALQQAETLLGRLSDQDPTFVILITDGAPTADGSSGNNPGNPADMTWNQFVNRYNSARDEARRINQRVSSNGAFYGIYAYGDEADLLDDLLYYAQNGQNNPRMSEGTDGSVPNYFNASDTESLTRAIDSIFNAVIKALGITEVSISDGTTSSVGVGSGKFELLEVVENYEYWLDIPLVDG
ncbi:MAG: vWA domain-containing protein [Coriobacteriales bacterium]|jgi:hypothetical protein